MRCLSMMPSMKIAHAEHVEVCRETKNEDGTSTSTQNTDERHDGHPGPCNSTRRLMSRNTRGRLNKKKKPRSRVRQHRLRPSGRSRICDWDPRTLEMVARRGAEGNERRCGRTGVCTDHFSASFSSHQPTDVGLTEESVLKKFLPV